MADQDDDEVNPVAVQRSANFLLAKEIQAGKIKPCTRSAYQRKVEILNQFLKGSHPNYYDSDVALHHTKRTYMCTCITLSTLYGLQTLDPIEVH